MNYLEWNNIVAKHFFNPDQVNKEIHLFISKQEIINLGKNSYPEKSDLEIWKDFLSKLKIGLPGSNEFPDIFDKALHCYYQWNQVGLKSIGGTPLKYPLYISFLVFSVLPLIEIQGDYNANNYYDRLEDFLKENFIKQNLRGKLKSIDHLWNDLSKWANEIKNGELGKFKLLNFEHTTWKFVGKPFSQCVFTPKAIRRLPDFFYSSNLIPNTFYQDEVFKNLLIQNGISQLGLKSSLVELIKKGNKDEIGQSVIETVKTEFNDWTGEEHEIILKDGEEKQLRKNTVAPIKLQFKVTENGEVLTSFRVNYRTSPPPKIKLDDFEDIYENENWSRTLNKDFKDYFEIFDKANRWKAIFESKNIRLFIRGGYFQLGNDFWVETEKLSRVEEMYILCKSNIKKSIEDWCATCCYKFRNENDLKNIPVGYSLFWFKGAFKSHETFQKLIVLENKRILFRFNTGLKVGHQLYLDSLLPEIEVANADGSENVYIQYENHTEKIYLQKHSILEEIWLLPNYMLPDTSFSIEIENSKSEGVKRAFKIIKESFAELSNDLLPKKNKFDEIVTTVSEFIQGNKICFNGPLNKIVDGQSFSPNTKANIQQEKDLEIKTSTLLKWLVAIKVCNLTKYNAAFETIFYNIFKSEHSNIQEQRSFSLSILDYLGYIDYNYFTGIIYTLPPKLISIPCTNGRKALLIGGRDEILVNKMKLYCLNSNNSISMSIESQSDKYTKMLIPDSIFLESNNIIEFETIASHFQIEFDELYILKLKSFLPTLKQFEESILNRGSSESWEKFGLEKKVFTKENLKFELHSQYDKTYSLTKCRPKYTPEYALWINNAYYIVDKNWGKYLFLNYCSDKIKGYGHNNHFSKPNEIFCKVDNLAIPASLSLPKLFSRLIFQLSGKAPDLNRLNLKGKYVWYNVYRNVPSLFMENFFRFNLNMIIEPTTKAI
jgi:hypothetical protein